MALWVGWSSVSASGWWSMFHLVHDECGWQSSTAYGHTDQDARQVRVVMAGHEEICPEPGYDPGD